LDSFLPPRILTFNRINSNCAFISTCKWWCVTCIIHSEKISWMILRTAPPRRGVNT